MDRVREALRAAVASPSAFSGVMMPGYRLRGYQAGPAETIGGAIARRLAGDDSGPGEFAIVFSRQAGKDEMLSQLFAWLMTRYYRGGGNIVVALPSMTPQGVIARDRLTARLRDSRLAEMGLRPRVSEGHIVRLGKASTTFISAAPGSSARGQTASVALVANEAQDIEPDRWDAVFAPMAASTNAVRVFVGTVWTADTLLAREMRYLSDLEAADGAQRVFRVSWRTVADELEQYGLYVAGEIARLGVDHPFIQTEYELKELDGAGGLFPPARRGQMIGDHGPLERARSGETYALTLDVAGEEEDEDPRSIVKYDPEARRDSTALTVVRVVPGAEKPTYEVVRRYLWTGVKHTALHAQIVDLARNVWRARYVVVDATGIGAGLASFLSESLGSRVVIPFVFSLASKSNLGWDFLGIVDSGRYKDLVYGNIPRSDRELAELTALFWQQAAAVTYEVRPGPNRLMSWAVPNARLHDDLIISAALVAELDKLDWRPRVATGGGRVSV